MGTTAWRLTWPRLLLRPGSSSRQKPSLARQLSACVHCVRMAGWCRKHTLALVWIYGTRDENTVHAQPALMVRDVSHLSSFPPLSSTAAYHVGQAVRQPKRKLQYYSFTFGSLVGSLPADRDRGSRATRVSAPPHFAALCRRPLSPARTRCRTIPVFTCTTASPIRTPRAGRWSWCRCVSTPRACVACERRRRQLGPCIPKGLSVPITCHWPMRVPR